MRITNNLLIHNMLWNMNNNLVSMNEKQTQLATGKRIHKPSDDPVGTTRIIKVKSDIAENLQYKENVRDAQSWLDVSENSLMDTKDILQRIRELAVQGANDTYTEEETDKIAKEIDQLLEELIVNANSTIAGRYLFSGFNTDEKLLNEDGTYNINITSEKMNDFKTIAYEVAVGEQLEVGTNYLDVYGMVLNDNVVTDTFVFGDVASGESRIGEEEAYAARHSKVQGPVDYKKDMTAETMTITVGTNVFTVDTSMMDGNITQAEYTDIILSAEQTTPAAPFPVPTLADVAEVYFVESDNPANEEGELVIEAKAFGSTAISVNASVTSAFETNPSVTNGENEIVGSTAILEGLFDYGTNYSSPAQQLSFKVGGKNYYVSSVKMNGSIASDADFINVLNSAENAEGGRLDAVATVAFYSLGGVGTVGKLTIEALEKKTETITFVDNAGGFANPAVTTGKAAVPASISGPFDKTVDLTSSTLSFYYDGTTYTVDTSTLDGTATDAAVIAAINGADDGSGNPLSSVAAATYDGTTLTVTANSSEDNKYFNYVDTGSGFTATPAKVTGITPVIPDFEGSFNITDVNANPLTFDFNGETYTVTTGAINAANFVATVGAAVDGGGNALSSVATITFESDPSDANLGNLSITSNSAVDGDIVINNPIGLTDVTTPTAGVAYSAATKPVSESVVDISTVFNSPPDVLSFEVDGTVYAVDATQLDGTITQGEFIDLIKNAPEPLPGTGKLSDVADITFTSHGGDGNIGTLKIEDTSAGTGTITIVDGGGIHVGFPVATDMEKAKIEGTFDFSTDYATDSESLAFEVDGTVYTVDTSTFDGSITEANFLLAIQNADDGSGNLLSSVANVSFNLDTGTTGQLTIEKTDGANANVRVTDTGGGFTSEPTLLDTETDAVITGTEEITDAMLADPEKGIGVQSFVVTFNDESKRIDVDLTGITTMAAMETVVNAKLQDAFGISDEPPKQNVTFDIFSDGEKDVVRFVADGNEDGSKAFLKVDVIVAEKPQMIQDVEEFSVALSNKDNDRIDQFLGEIDDHLDNVIKNLASIGAKTNRLDFIENRINDNNIAMTEILTQVQDIDFAEVTIKFKSLESIYRASLSVGAKVIQPTLVDFLQ